MSAAETEPDVPRARSSNSCITLLTPLRWWGPAWLRAQFAVTQRFPGLTGLRPFNSVYFSRWTIVTRFARNGRPQLRERPRPPCLLWEVVYSAETDPYIESFSVGIPRQINAVWGSSHGFPGPRSATRLRRYIEDLAWSGSHDYWAYPDASVRMVLSALEIAKEHEFLRQAAATSDAESFATTYEGFLQRRGADL